MGFFRVISPNAADQNRAGNAIIEVSKSVFSSVPGNAWKEFEADPREWLAKYGYVHVDANGAKIGDGKCPANVRLVPVYDSEHTMHVRIPWQGDIAAAQTLQVDNEPPYNGSFPALLARYFMRKCR